MAKKQIKQPISATVPEGRPGLPTQRRAAQVDLEVGALLRVLNVPGHLPSRLDELRRQRHVAELLARTTGCNVPVAEAREFYVRTEGGMVEARLYRAHHSSQPQPAFVWFHGGAFVLGGLSTADTICRQIARTSGVTVISVRYRLAPENNLYAGREDCLAVVKWLHEHGEEVGVDGSRLAVGGDSAGGNLAAAVAQRCVQQEGIPLRLQVLAYPATNLRDDFPSKQENAKGYLLTADIIDSVSELLGADEIDSSDPWLSPALNPNLHDLPPAVILTAGFDPIRDDGLTYAQLLRGADVPVQLLHYPGQFHGFLNFDGLLLVARDALTRMGHALRTALVPELAPAMPNQTVEISAPERIPGRTRTQKATSRVINGVLMVGERLEYARAELVREALKRAPILYGLGWWSLSPERSPLLNPVTALRASLAASFAPIRAHQSFNQQSAAPERRSSGRVAVTS